MESYHLLLALLHWNNCTSSQKFSFNVLKIAEEEWEREFSSPRAVPEHMKHTGVNDTSPANWGKTAYRRFCKEYSQNFSVPNGVTLSYRPLWLIAKK